MRYGDWYAILVAVRSIVLFGSKLKYWNKINSFAQNTSPKACHTQISIEIVELIIYKRPIAPNVQSNERQFF